MISKNSEIYGQGYEKWEGVRNHARPAWFLIGTSAIRNLLMSSGCLARSLFIVFFVIYYFWVNAQTIFRTQWETISQWEFLRDIGRSFDPSSLGVEEIFYHKMNTLYPSLFFCTLVMVFYGSQLISKDRQANALQVYFSKAVSRLDYVLGKFFAVGIMTSLTTLVPSAMILIVGLVLSPDRAEFLAQSWFIPFVAVAYWLLLSSVLGSVILFFSSSFDKGYLAAVSFIGFLFFAMVTSGLLMLIFGHRFFLEGLNWGAGLVHMGTVIFDREVTNWAETGWKLFDLLIITGVCGSLVFRQIRPVEVVK